MKKKGSEIQFSYGEGGKREVESLVTWTFLEIKEEEEIEGEDDSNATKTSDIKRHRISESDLSLQFSILIFNI